MPTETQHILLHEDKHSPSITASVKIASAFMNLISRLPPCFTSARLPLEKLLYDIWQLINWKMKQRDSQTWPDFSSTQTDYQINYSILQLFLFFCFFTYSPDLFINSNMLNLKIEMLMLFTRRSRLQMFSPCQKQFVRKCLLPDAQ